MYTIIVLIFVLSFSLVVDGVGLVLRILILQVINCLLYLGYIHFLVCISLSIVIVSARVNTLVRSNEWPYALSLALPNCCPLSSFDD